MESRSLLAADVPSLLVDLNADTAPSNVGQVVSLNGTAYFTADDGVGGKGLYRSDGTTPNTSRVFDRDDFDGAHTATHLTVSGENLYFFTKSGQFFRLWVIDGTPGADATPRELLQFPNGINHNSVEIRDVVPFTSDQPGDDSAGDHLLFTFTGGANEIWFTDGTVGRTRFVRDFTGIISWGVGKLTHVGHGEAYFSVPMASPREYEVWRTDGTTGGTRRVATPIPGSTRSPDGYARLGTEVVFRGAGENTALWITDGTAGNTRRLQPDIADGAAEPVVPVQGAKRAFVGITAGQRTLWTTDGTVGGTAPLFAPGAAPFVEPESLTAFEHGDAAVFVARAESGGPKEVWVTDGTPLGTQRLADAPSVKVVNGAFHVAGNLAFYNEFNSTTGATALWRTDGTPAGTVRVVAADNDRGGNFLAEPPVALADGGFAFSYSTPLYGRELWRTDGTPAGTTLLADVNRRGHGTSIGGVIQASPDKAYFAGAVSGTGYELFVTDGTPAGTRMVKELNPGSANGTVFSAGNAVLLGDGRLLFSGSTPDHGNELWITDGTADGTRLVKDVTPGTAGTNMMSLTTVFNGVAYFAAPSVIGNSFTRELWRTDGTEAGTYLLKDIRPGNASSNPGDFTVAGGRLFFSADDGVNGRELWTTDGTAEGTAMLKDVNPGSEGMQRASTPLQFTAVGPRLFFVALNPETWLELWTSDGTAEGTRLVKDIAPGTLTPSIDSLVNYNGELFFTANNAGARALWRSDGTEAGTEMVAPNIGAQAFDRRMTVAGDLLFFKAYTGAMSAGAGAYRVYRSDGTDAGTFPVGPEFPFRTGEGIGELKAVDGKAYFVAATATDVGLFESDGTDAGTRFIDSRPSAVPPTHLPQYDLMRVGGRMLMAKADAFSGYEWHALGASPVAQLAAGPVVARGGQVVTFDAGISTGDVAGYAWDLDYDGVTFTPDAAAGTAATTSFPAPQGPARRTIAVRVSGAGGWTSIAAAPLTSLPGEAAPPRVALAFVSGTGWSSGFREHIQAASLGDARFGFAIDPAAPPDELPWTNVNSVSVRFSRDVKFTQGSLNVSGVEVATYGAAAFAYDPATFTATWTLGTAGVAADKLALDLSGVTDAATGAALTGPSRVRLHVLPGDASRSGGTVNAGDVTQVRNRQFTDTATPGISPNTYSVFHDVNGNGVINAQDVTLTRNRQFTSLPASEPPALLTTTTATLTSAARRRLIDGLV